MKQGIFISALLLLNFLGYAQENGNENNLESSLSIDIGYGGRITPIYPEGFAPFSFTRSPSVSISSNKNLAGSNLNIGLRYHFLRKYRIEFRYAARYDHIGYEDFDYASHGSGYRPDINAFLSEYHGAIGMNIHSKQDFDIDVYLGLGVLNVGSDFATYKTEITNRNDTFFTRSEADFVFHTYNIGLNLKKNKMALDLNFYYSHKSTIKFPDKSPFILPELRFRYYISENLLGKE